jgi:hypothetical protein
MKLEKFNLLKKRFEENAFEHNFLTLDRILYWFSFLGNIFSIIFSYFFIKTVTDTIPTFFSWQAAAFAVFIVVFMTGFEFLKRFTFEQVVVHFFKIRKASAAFVGGLIFALTLIAGSFYMSLHGSHRLIDQTEVVNQYSDTTIQVQVDSLSASYGARIASYQKLIDGINASAVDGKLKNKDKADVKAYESKVADLQKELETKTSEIESKVTAKANAKLEGTKDNTTALVMLTLFMELIILLGVGFNGYYSITSFVDMKQLMNTPKYKTLQLNLSLLHLFYQKGNKKENDQTLAITKLKALASNQKLDVRGKDIEEFIALCTELGIINVANNKKKYYVCSYDKAKELLTNNI